MRVPVDGAELFYSTRGSGPPCLVPTAIGTAPYERLTPPPLSDRLTLVYLDLRGGGQSTGDAATLTFDVLAADFDAVRADLGVERLAVLGHSINGVLAIEYARRRPERVSHVIAAGTPPFADMARLSAAAAAFFDRDASEDRKRVLRDNLAGLPAAATLGQMMRAQTPTRFFDPRLDTAPLFAGSIAKPGLLQHIMGPLTAGWEVTTHPTSLRVPMFIAHGRYDYTVPYVLWDGIVSRLPRATMRLFERSGHHPFFEEPEAFAQAVTEWMGTET